MIGHAPGGKLSSAAPQHPEVTPPAIGSGFRFEGVTVTYRGTVALADFTLEAPAGQVTALLGPSGSGKTTALRSVAGFVRPARGRVYIGGRDVTDVPAHDRGIGIVVQQYALFPHMRVAENVAFGLKAKRRPRAEVRAGVSDALELVGMADYARRYPRELSGGQQQRVAIARALAIQPKGLLLDEPLSALDAQLRSGMLAEIARLHRELPDLTILYVTHDQVEALTLADRIAVMNEARLVDVGTSRELYQRPQLAFTAGFVGHANLLPVTVSEIIEKAAGEPGAGPCLVRADLGGQQLTATAYRAVEAGSQQLLCIRPHLFSLTPEASSDNRLEGTVTEVQWRGPTHRIYLDAGGHGLIAEAAARRDPPPLGSRLALYFTPGDAVLVAAGTGAAGD
ncbi:MAG: ABC transporter ATP-binding protein [Actinobacteria bacterium]|nr:ABC transporter ATP-binding protein [Actinomycetota bacterium]